MIVDRHTIDRLGFISTSYGTAGFVIDKPGYYVVLDTLNVTNVDIGILILADHVTVDFNRYGLSDTSGTSTLVRSIVDGELVIKNGRLMGGKRTIDAIGSTGSTLSIDGVTMDGGTVGSGFMVTIDGVQDVKIRSNTVRSMEAAISVSNYSFGLIENNLVEAAGVGVQATASRPIEIRRNLIRAAEALILQDASIVKNNVLRSTHPSNALVTLTGHWNALTNNRITATGSVCAINSIDFANVIADNTIDGTHTYSICLDAFTRAERNRMTGATGSSIRAVSRGNWISVMSRFPLNADGGPGSCSTRSSLCCPAFRS